MRPLELPHSFTPQLRHHKDHESGLSPFLWTRAPLHFCLGCYKLPSLPGDQRLFLSPQCSWWEPWEKVRGCPGSTPSPELQRVEVLGEGDLGNSRVRREWTLVTLLKSRGSEGLGPSAGLTLAFVIQVPVPDCLPFVSTVTSSF